MKIFTKALLASILAAGAVPAAAQTLYDNFENTRLVSYPVVEGTLTQNTANPGINAVNGSPICATYVRAGGAQFAVLVVKPNNARMDNVAPYAAGTKRISIKFRSPAVGVVVGAVLQNGAKANTLPYPAGKFGTEFTATTTVANAWETLTFTSSAASGGNFDPSVLATDIDQMLFQVAPNSNNAGTYYLDDINGPELITGPTTTLAVRQLYDNFDGTRAIKYIAYKSSGGLRVDTLNPAPSTINNSARVARYSRSTNQFDVLVVHPRGAALADVTNFKNNTQRMTMKVFSPAAGIVFQITLQDSTVAGATNYPAGRNSEYTATTSVANAWETLTLNYVSGSYDAAVRPTEIDRMDFQIAPGANNGGTFYFDDFRGAPTTLPVARLYENFNDTRVLTYGFADGVLTQSAPNPSQGGPNPNPRVGRYVRSAAQQYDTFYAQLPAAMDDATEFQNNDRHFSMRVYCPEPVGTLVTVTFTDAAATPTNYPTGRPSVYSATTTVQNGWQTLTFNYLFSPTGGNNEIGRASCRERV